MTNHAFSIGLVIKNEAAVAVYQHKAVSEIQLFGILQM